MQAAVEAIKGEAIREHKDTIIETIRNYELDGKALKDVAEKHYFNHLVEKVLKEIADDDHLMSSVLDMIHEKAAKEESEQFRMRVVKLVKKEIVTMFKDDISILMGNKKVVLDEYMPKSESE